MEKKDIIDLSGQNYYDAEGFRNGIIDVIRLIQEILRRAESCDMDASEIANRSYILDWIAYEAEIKYERK